MISIIEPQKRPTTINFQIAYITYTMVLGNAILIAINDLFNYYFFLCNAICFINIKFIFNDMCIFVVYKWFYNQQTQLWELFLF